VTTSSPSSATEQPPVLVVGEALVDIVDGVARPGGSPTNVAVALGRLGVPVILATQLGNDDHGRLIRAHVADSRVQLLAARASRTSTATAVLDAAGAASYTFEVDWAPEFASLPRVEVGHVGSFSAVAGPVPSTPTLSYDINVRPALMPPDPVDRVEAVVARATLVKASDEDLAWLYPERPWEQAARRLLDLGPRIVWVTRGGEGAVGVTTSELIDVPSPRVHVVDTIGAGDAFSAGLLAGLLRYGEDWRRIGHLAARVAAITVTRPGADPPWSHELDAGTIR
jgi:fructokinase